jgi:hypothetical protein
MIIQLNEMMQNPMQRKILNIKELPAVVQSVVRKLSSEPTLRL